MSNVHHIASCSQCRSDGADTDTETVTKAVSTFCGSSVPTQGAIVSALLDRMHPSQLRCLAAKLALATRVDFIARLAPELGLKIFNYLDARSLCHAAQVAAHWRSLADDDLIWHRMCKQHIDKKCKTCGWGLPIIRSAQRGNSNPSAPLPSIAPSSSILSNKRKRADSSSSESGESSTQSSAEAVVPKRRAFKSIYAERLVVERNWRKPVYKASFAEGHEATVLCLQYNDCAGRFVSGGEDRTLRVWDADTNTCIARLTGHANAVTGVQFDQGVIMSCSLDRTVRIWSMRDFECTQILRGHRDGVTSLHFVDELLASGSRDTTIRVLNRKTGKLSVLRGHSDWVNKVHIYQKTQLFSCSDDHTVRLWNIESGEVLRQFTGHHDRIASFSLSLPHMRTERANAEGRGGVPKLVTASADKTVKVWDIDTGACLKTLFGHEGGVVCVASDTLRIVSGSMDNRIMVFDVESGKVMHSMGVDGMPGTGAINCCVLSDTKIMTGGEDGVVRTYNFYPETLTF